MRGVGLRCRAHGERDVTAQYRTQHHSVLCAACYVDAQTSSTRKLAVQDVKTYNDRYAQLAVKYGVN